MADVRTRVAPNMADVRSRVDPNMAKKTDAGRTKNGEKPLLKKLKKKRISLISMATSSTNSPVNWFPLEVLLLRALDLDGTVNGKSWKQSFYQWEQALLKWLHSSTCVQNKPLKDLALSMKWEAVDRSRSAINNKIQNLLLQTVTDDERVLIQIIVDWVKGVDSSSGSAHPGAAAHGWYKIETLLVRALNSVAPADEAWERSLYMWTKALLTSDQLRADTRTWPLIMEMKDLVVPRPRSALHSHKINIQDEVVDDCDEEPLRVISEWVKAVSAHNGGFKLGHDFAGKIVIAVTSEGQWTVEVRGQKNSNPPDMEMVRRALGSAYTSTSFEYWGEMRVLSEVSWFC